jgi:hypothetical protein
MESRGTQMGHVRFVLIFTISLVIQSAAANSGFEGAPDLHPIEDSFLERYRTTSEFIYRQTNGRVWVVPSSPSLFRLSSSYS